jgi:hypothetical protein
MLWQWLDKFGSKRDIVWKTNKCLLFVDQKAAGKSLRQVRGAHNLVESDFVSNCRLFGSRFLKTR